MKKAPAKDPDFGFPPKQARWIYGSTGGLMILVGMCGLVLTIGKVLADSQAKPAPALSDFVCSLPSPSRAPRPIVIQSRIPGTAPGLVENPVGLDDSMIHPAVPGIDDPMIQVAGVGIDEAMIVSPEKLAKPQMRALPQSILALPKAPKFPATFPAPRLSPSR